MHPQAIYSHKHVITVLMNRRFRLERIEFHAKSEHLLNGVRFPLEAELVHRSAEYRYLVLSVLFKKGAKNNFLDHALEWAKLPQPGKTNYLPPLDPAGKAPCQNFSTKNCHK